MSPIVLQAWPTLNALQREQIGLIRIEAAQLAFSGTIERAIALCETQSGPDLCGVAILRDARPIGFMVLKRGQAAPDWVPTAAAVIGALRLDVSVQGQGLGQQALLDLPAWLARYWPGLERIVLRVDESNTAGIRAYEKAGWREEGPPRQGRVGMERSMTRWLLPQPATEQTE